MEKNSNISYESLMPADMRSSWQENVEAEVDDIVELIQTSLLKIPPLVALQLRSLWKTSHLLLFCDPLQSRKYMYQFMKSSHNENIILPDNIALLLCQSCYIIQIPQHTCTYKTVKRKYKKVRPHEASPTISTKNRYRHNLIRTCLLCQHTTKSLCHETIKKKPNTENILKTPKSLTYTPTSSSAISSTSSTKFSFLHSTYNNTNTNTLEKSITKLTTTTSSSNNNTNNNMMKTGNSLSGNFISLKSPTTGQNLSKKFASILSSPLSAISTLNIKNNSDNNTPNGGKVSLLELEKSTKKKKRSLLKSNSSESIISTSYTAETTDHLNISCNTDDMNIVPSNNGDMDNNDYQNKEVNTKSSEFITTPNTKNNPIICGNINSDQFTGINIVLDTIGSPLKKARVSNVNKNDLSNGNHDMLDNCKNNTIDTTIILQNLTNESSTDIAMNNNSTNENMTNGSSGDSNDTLTHKHLTVNLRHITSSSNDLKSSSNTLTEGSSNDIELKDCSINPTTSTTIEIKPKINIQYANRLTKFIVKSNEYHDRMNQISTINTTSTTPTTNTITTTTSPQCNNNTSKTLSHDIQTSSHIQSNNVLTEVHNVIDSNTSCISNVSVKRLSSNYESDNNISSSSSSSSSSSNVSSSNNDVQEDDVTTSMMSMKDFLPPTRRKKTILRTSGDPLSMTTTTANITSTATTNSSRNTVVSSTLFKSAGLFNKVISDIASNKSTTLLHDTSNDDSNPTEVFQMISKIPNSVNHIEQDKVSVSTLTTIHTTNGNYVSNTNIDNILHTDLSNLKQDIMHCIQNETTHTTPNSTYNSNISDGDSHHNKSIDSKDTPINKMQRNGKTPPIKLLSSALRSTIQFNKVLLTSPTSTVITNILPVAVAVTTALPSEQVVTTPINTLHTINKTIKINDNIDDNKKKNTTMKANIPKNIKNNPLATIRKHLQSK